MKKSILLLGVAALAFGACTDKNKTYDLNGDEQIVDAKAISGNVYLHISCRWARG